MKYETAEMKPVSEAIDDEINSNSLEAISTQKLTEYFELLKLKQQHPEFAEDINAQLLSFTNDSLTAKNYKNGFSISNIKQSGTRKAVSDTVKVFTLTYTVTTDSEVFQDSVLTSINSVTSYLQSVEAVSIKKVRFEKFKK
jgi:hypothetical protein